MRIVLDWRRLVNPRFAPETYIYIGLYIAIYIGIYTESTKMHTLAVLSIGRTKLYLSFVIGIDKPYRLMI